MADFLLYLSALWAGAAVGFFAASVMMQAGDD